MRIAVHVGESNLDEILNEMVENEVEAFECGPRFFNDSDERKIRDTARALRENGIRIWSVHAPFGESCNLSSLNPEERSKAIDAHKTLLRKVALAEAELVVVHPGVGEEDETKCASMLKLVPESIYDMLPVAEEVGVKIAVENMLPKHPGSSASEIKWIVESFNSPYVGVCFDSGHAHVNGEALEALRLLGPLIITFHLHDNDGTRDMHLQPPYGTLDWDGFSKILGQMDFNDPIVIEAAPWQGAGMRWLQKEVRSLFEFGLPDLRSSFDCGDDGGERISLRCRRCGHYLFRGEDGLFCRCGVWNF